MTAGVVPTLRLRSCRRSGFGISAPSVRIITWGEGRLQRPSFYIWRASGDDVGLVREVHRPTIQSGAGKDWLEGDQGAGLRKMLKVRFKYEGSTPDQQSVRHHGPDSVGMRSLRSRGMEAIQKWKAARGE